MRVAIAGFTVEGRSAFDYWRKKGADITILDQNPAVEVPEGVKSRLGQNYLDDLDQYDLVSRTPGIKPSLLEASRAVTSVTKEFLAHCPAPVIGVTGTKGKGTTVSLIHAMLEADGKTAWLGGNIGAPPLDFLEQVKPSDYVVLELSSFQLMDADQSPQIAVCLMVAPDHLDYHVDLDEYYQAKGNLFRFQRPADLAIFHPLNEASRSLAQLSPGRQLPYTQPPGAYISPLSSSTGRAKPTPDRASAVTVEGQEIIRTADIGLIGRHNHQNVCAAVTAVWDIIDDPEPVRVAIKGFKGLPHRLQLVAEKAGVRYYDDSIATIPEAAISAIEAFSEPKVVILGGSDKGADYTDLAKIIASNNVIKAILMGQTAPAIAGALDKIGLSNYQLGITMMSEVVNTAAKAAPDGGVVLLAPGCASFGLFRDYADRGDQFQAAVKAL